MTTDPQPDAAVSYASYLALDEVLGAQRPRSEEHDEHLFIVVHQVYELWFKQLLHELAHLQAALEAGETSRSLHTLGRILTILKVAVAQIDVLETMTPRQFTSFRARLDTASGFQSAQFREIEAVLGRRDAAVGRAHAAGSEARARIEAAVARPSLFDSYVTYLGHVGFPVDPVAPGGIEDVLVAVYTADGEPAQLAERLVDLDEGLQEWRYRHVKMVERTIGDRIGTGGSAGAEYLRRTLFSPLFPALWAVRSRL
ncbi:tryptophan 2,3-dioxygenase [Iamia sp. SCSIO 61187]|uniref:tryptophan 2,3-dioxygenase n=1 Tax=Iamia sp. SCSIO 61187 TaxID=2722752 RepID=UPI001C62DE75|nr:tryptophan 2,3-dioxygenase family protein [Iamia sp. SCSIO 61187]QYG94649.1 tryptophan 2,3-dioxygenase [Iamia sp. SCSIO 61187]